MKSTEEILRAAGVQVLSRMPTRPAPVEKAPKPAAPRPTLPIVAGDPAANGSTVCVVTCHNYARFLRQCLDSLIAQSLPFDHVVLVDDASDDDTPGIGADYAPNVLYVRGEWRDAAEARRAGVAAVPRSRFLLFVDADNWLDSEFHARLRAAMHDARVGVAYGTIRAVDEKGGHIYDLARPFDYARLRRHNYVDMCSLVRTEAYMQVGGFENVGGLQDWALWLKVTRAGWLMHLVPEAILNYRKHPASMTAHRQASQMDEEGHVKVMRRSFTIAIVTLFSGREWMLDRYAMMIRDLDWPTQNLRIVAIDNSRRPSFTMKLASTLYCTGVPHIIAQNDRVAVEGRAADFVCDSRAIRTGYGYAINEHLAHLYSFAREHVPAAADLVWVLEDDIEPPADALEHFSRGLMRNQQAAVITGAVCNRFGGGLIAWRGNWNDHETRILSAHLNRPPALDTFERITGSGFHCTIFRREAWDALAFRPSPYWSLRQPYYDWAAAHQIGRLGWQWLIAGSVRCKHWQADGTALVPEDSTEAAGEGYY